MGLFDGSQMNHQSEPGEFASKAAHLRARLAKNVEKNSCSRYCKLKIIEVTNKLIQSTSAKTKSLIPESWVIVELPDDS